MFICTDCGRLYDEMPVHTEHHDDYYSELVNSDCCCGGMIDEAKRCKVCGEYVTEDDIVEGVCEDCLHLEMKAKSVESFIDSYRIAERTYFNLNPIIEHVFTDDEVNEILLREIKNILNHKLMMPSRLEYAMKHDLQEDWAAFLAKTKGVY